MTTSPQQEYPLDPKLVAAVTAAVQAYLDEEPSSAEEQGAKGISTWKLAAWRSLSARKPAARRSLVDRRLLRGLSWRGRG